MLIEREAREKIVQWAENHYHKEGEPLPIVEVITPAYDALHEWWQTELIVVTSTVTYYPLVTFWQPEVPGHPLQVSIK